MAAEIAREALAHEEERADAEYRRFLNEKDKLWILMSSAKSIEFKGQCCAIVLASSFSSHNQDPLVDQTPASWAAAQGCGFKVRPRWTAS